VVVNLQSDQWSVEFKKQIQVSLKSIHLYVYVEKVSCKAGLTFDHLLYNSAVYKIPCSQAF